MNKKQQLRLEKYLDERPSVTSVGIAISMYMGLRIGEVCALQWKEIDLEKRVLTVSKTIQRVQCRTGSKQTKLIITEPKSESSKRTILSLIACFLCSDGLRITVRSMWCPAGKSLLSQEQCSTASLKYCITQICRHSTITACAIYLQQGVSNWALM